MIRRLLNRLFGRTDSSIDAVNAFVEGNASDDEKQIVERMKRQDHAFEKDLATQQALREVLGRIEKVEAPRSFAITPEMVEAAERKDSSLTRIAELFGPQRKLALAPAIIAGIAALSVALLTLGDFTGLVDQSGRTESFSAFSIADSRGITGESSAAAPSADISAASVPELEIAAEAQADAGTNDVTAIAPESASPPLVNSSDASADGPPSLSFVAPEQGAGKSSGDTTLPGSSDDEFAAERSFSKSTDPVDSSDSNNTVTGDGAALTESESAIEPANNNGLVAESAVTGDGILLPLWQLQIALAALAIAAIGAWAGLRRLRDE